LVGCVHPAVGVSSTLRGPVVGSRDAQSPNYWIHLFCARLNTTPSLPQHFGEEAAGAAMGAAAEAQQQLAARLHALEANAEALAHLADEGCAPPPPPCPACPPAGLRARLNVPSSGGAYVVSQSCVAMLRCKAALRCCVAKLRCDAALQCGDAARRCPDHRPPFPLPLPRQVRQPRAQSRGACAARRRPPPPLPPLRTKWTRRVLHSVLIGHAASLRRRRACARGAAGSLPARHPPARHPAVARASLTVPCPPSIPRWFHRVDSERGHETKSLAPCRAATGARPTAGRAREAGCRCKDSGGAGGAAVAVCMKKIKCGFKFGPTRSGGRAGAGSRDIHNTTAQRPRTRLLPQRGVLLSGPEPLAEIAGAHAAPRRARHAAGGAALLQLRARVRGQTGEGRAGGGRGVSDQYGVKDAPCPISTG
jgi:hypothetical protein